MDYVIVSPRVGTPGAAFVPPPGVNVDALIDGGFIKAAPKPAKSGKLTTETEGAPDAD